ncbi:MAG: hypothetical protein WC875_05750 [Candidatus Absconditabacterales bacterium]
MLLLFEIFLLMIIDDHKKSLDKGLADKDWKNVFTMLCIGIWSSIKKLLTKIKKNINP